MKLLVGTIGLHAGASGTDKHVNATFHPQRRQRSGVKTSVLSKMGPILLMGLSTGSLPAVTRREMGYSLRPWTLSHMPFFSLCHVLYSVFPSFLIPLRDKATSLMALLRCEEGQRRMSTHGPHFSPNWSYYHKVHTRNPSQVPFVSYALHPTFHRLTGRGSGSHSWWLSFAYC